MALDFGDIASRYAQARWDQATQPFTDPEAYLNNRMQNDFGVDMNGNVKPKSTTISYNDDGTQTVTQKHEVVPTASEQTVTQPSYTPPPMPQFGPGVQVASATPTLPQTQAAMPVTPDQLAEEQKRKQLEALQLQQAQQAAVQQSQTPAPVAQPAPQLPQPGPAVQVAGPAQLPQAQSAVAPVQAAPAPAPAPVAQPVARSVAQPVAQAAPVVQAAPAAAPAPTMPMATAEGQLRSWTDDVAAIGNNVTALGKYISNEANPEEGRMFAGKVISKIYKEKEMQDKAQQKAMEAVQSGDLLPLVRETKKNTEEASYIKAYLFARLGLNDLAKEEQKKLGAGATYQAVTGPNNEKAIIKYSADGLPMSGYGADGKELTSEKLASLATNALPQKAHLLPSAHGTPVINAQGVMGQMMYDPQTQSTYVQVGDKRMNTAGWTTMAQNVQNVYGASGAGQLGKQAAQTGTQQPALPGMAGNVPQVQQAPMYPSAAPAATPIQQQVAQQQAQQQVAAQAAGPVSPAQVAQQPAPAPAPVARPTPAPAAPSMAGGTVVQQPGESYTSFQQRQKAAEEATAADIQRRKEVAVAEQKLPAEAKGKQQAKIIQQQAFADNAYPLVKEIGKMVEQSTGSRIGAKVDDIARIIGSSPNGAQAIAQLNTFSAPLVSMVPRFEGSQSDRDVQMYQKQAGDFANDKLPVKERLAALQGMVKLLKIYDKNNTNDWDALRPAQSDTRRRADQIIGGGQ